MAFVYPMIGLCGLSVFLGSLLTKGWGEPEHFQYAMTRCCAMAVSLFGGFFLAAYLINGMRVRLLEQESDVTLCQQFAGYSLVLIFLQQIVVGLLPSFYIIALLLTFYTVYIVWEGADRLVQVAEKKRLQFTLLSSALLMVCPLFIDWLFNKLTLLLN